MKKLSKELEQYLYHDIEDEDNAFDAVMDIVHLVGFLCMYFNGLERQLDKIICELFTTRTDATGLLVLHNMNYTSKVDLFKRFENYFQVCVGKEIENFDELIFKLRECARLRNLAIHADWESSNEEGYTYVNLKFSKSGIIQEYVQFSEKSLEDIIKLIFETRSILDKYWEKHNEILQN